MQHPTEVSSNDRYVKVHYTHPICQSQVSKVIFVVVQRN
jgi:hypothetical protein